MARFKNGTLIIDSAEEIRMQGNPLTGAEIKDYAESKAIVSSSGNAATFDLEDGNVFTITLTEDSTFTFSNPPISGKAGNLSMILTQDGTPRTITWPGSVNWAGGTEADISTASAVYVLTFLTVDAGTTWYGFLSGSEMAAP